MNFDRAIAYSGRCASEAPRFPLLAWILPLKQHEFLQRLPAGHLSGQIGNKTKTTLTRREFSRKIKGVVKFDSEQKNALKVLPTLGQGVKIRRP